MSQTSDIVPMRGRIGRANGLAPLKNGWGGEAQFGRSGPTRRVDSALPLSVAHQREDDDGFPAMEHPTDLRKTGTSKENTREARQ